MYVITGDSGMGLTHGTLGGRLVAELILGRADPLAGVYDPKRWMPAALKTLFQENLNLAAQYADWLTGGDVSSADHIPPGQGAVVRAGLTNPALSEAERVRLVRELSAARAALRRSAGTTPAGRKAARANVNATKIALGERGPVWWTDGAPDFNRRMANNTPYRGWYESLPDEEKADTSRRKR